MKWPYIVCTLLVSVFLLWESPACAQKRYTPEGRDRWKNPLELKEMTEWEKISFNPARFVEIQEGMSESEVLDILGKPKNLTKERRPGNRWNVHYFYTGGHIVNFFNGRVVGKKIDKENNNPWN
jgi:hypothetical protein